ncbi:MAG TPA: hypothetical protein VK400_18760 [Pyrinomonadaceae bacterium]|nr:hypothetical protein [Pyrinomonadaceae bacterium]
MHPLVEKLEKRLLPEFEKIAEKIRREIPNVLANIESHSSGFDEYSGHAINISCLLTKDYFTESDNVALCIGISTLVSTPKIDACVCWGHPSGYIEKEFADNPLEASDEILENLYKDLPHLYEALFEALKRRKPGNE